MSRFDILLSFVIGVLVEEILDDIKYFVIWRSELRNRKRYETWLSKRYRNEEI